MSCARYSREHDMFGWFLHLGCSCCQQQHRTSLATHGCHSHVFASQYAQPNADPCPLSPIRRVPGRGGPKWDAQSTLCMMTSCPRRVASRGVRMPSAHEVMSGTFARAPAASTLRAHSRTHHSVPVRVCARACACLEGEEVAPHFASAPLGGGTGSLEGSTRICATLQSHGTTLKGRR